MFTVKIIREDGSVLVKELSSFEFISPESDKFQEALNITPAYLTKPYTKDGSLDILGLGGESIAGDFTMAEPIGFGDEVYITNEQGKTVFSIKGDSVYASPQASGDLYK